MSEQAHLSLHKKLYTSLYRIRRVEEEVVRIYPTDKIKSPVHLSIGQEAVSVGVCEALKEQDVAFGSYRSHALYIAKGGDLKGMMAELYGKSTGSSKGKGGSMHLADFSIGILGESGIVASALPVAVGAALGSKMQGTDRVVVAFFGDGASNQGPCHEAMNLASIWKLPVIFLCENNGWAVSVPASYGLSVEDVAGRASGYNLPGVTVDGTDVLAVHETVQQAVQRARAGDGATLVECKTYRFFRHHSTLRETRSLDEVARWKQRDPLAIMAGSLKDQGILDDATIAKMDQRIGEELDAEWEKQSEGYDKVVNLTGSMENELLFAYHQPLYSKTLRERREYVNGRNYFDYHLEKAGYTPNGNSVLPEIYFSKAERNKAKSLRNKHKGLFIITWALTGSAIHKIYRYFEQTMTTLSALSRITSISYSFQPMSDSSIRTSFTGERSMPFLAISSNSSRL